jgi:hypothetical protein
MTSYCPALFDALYFDDKELLDLEKSLNLEKNME